MDIQMIVILITSTPFLASLAIKSVLGEFVKVRGSTNLLDVTVLLFLLWFFLIF